MNQHHFTWLNIGACHKHVPGCKRNQRHRSRLLPTKICRLRKDIDARHCYEFRITAVASIANHIVLATEIILSPQALGAVPTGNSRLDHHLRTGPDPTDQLPNLLHYTGDVTTENVRQRYRDP